MRFGRTDFFCDFGGIDVIANYNPMTKLYLTLQNGTRLVTKDRYSIQSKYNKFE